MRALMIVVVIALIVAAIVFLPWILFWCIGVLFDYHIEFTLKNWFAGFILLGLIAGSGSAR